jgi:carbon catabolite-derepressing protein kinase
MNSGTAHDVPRAIGNYVYVRTIGTGYCSTVCLVRRNGTECVFAAKVVSRQFLSDHGALEHFDRELRVLESLRHPHIVRLEEVVYLPDYICVIMEYYAGGDLLACMSGFGKIPEDRAQELFFQLASAVRYIHQRNVSHRDIKLENILLDDLFNVHLADFGFSVVAAPDALINTPCGSPFYTAPEVIDSREYDGRKADIWSLGICLYAMCVGQIPWDTDCRPRLYTQIVETDVVPPGYLSCQLRKLLSAMLDRNPETRITIDEVIESSWLADVREAQIPGKRTWERRMTIGMSQSCTLPPITFRNSARSMLKSLPRANPRP